VGVNIISQGPALINMGFQSNLDRITGNYYNTTNFSTNTLYPSNFPYDTWIKAEMFIDYNTNHVYFYLPTLNIQKSGSFSHSRIPENISVNVLSLGTLSSVVKIDNIKASALQTLPSYILSVNDFVSKKFNVFPNPANNVVNITNSESIGIEQITIFDTTGKMLKTQIFNNENEVQLNLNNFASGIYMLHI